MSSHREVLVQGLLLVLASMAVWVPRTKGPIDLRWDAGAYYVLGTSIAQSHDYRYLNEPGSIHTTVWPPGEPLIVAAHQILLGTSDPLVVGRALRLTYFLLYTANLLTAFAVLRGYLPSLLAAGLALVSTWTVAAVWVSDRAYADLPFALAVNVFLLSLGGHSRRGGIRGVLGGFAAVGAFTLRTVGLAILGAWVVEAISRRERGSVIARIAVSGACVLAWATYIGIVERSDEYRRPAYPYQRAAYNLYNVSYTTNFSLRAPNQPERGSLTLGEWPRRIGSRLRDIPEGLAGTVGNSRGDWEIAVAGAKTLRGWRSLVPWRLIPAVLFASAALISIGLMMLVARKQVTIVTLIAFYIGLLCLLPSADFWPRFLSSVGTITALALGIALVSISSRLSPGRLRRLVMFGPVVGLLVSESLALVWFFTHEYSYVSYSDWAGRRVDYRLFSYDADFTSFDAGIDWLRPRASAGDIVISSIPHWVYLRTGLQAIMPPAEPDRTRVLQLLATTGARYVIVDSSGVSSAREYAKPALDAAPAEWIVVYGKNSALEIFERRAHSVP